jgi:HPr kinase/phosphorylase
MTAKLTPTVHATAVSIGGQGVLLVGPPGSGKSDLALRLIDRGAKLIADDRVRVDSSGLLSPPPAIAGLIEVRGFGLAQMAHVSGIAAKLLVDLGQVPDRMPHPAVRCICGLELPCMMVSAFEASTPLKVELAVAQGLPTG